MSQNSAQPHIYSGTINSDTIVGGTLNNLASGTINSATVSGSMIITSGTQSVGTINTGTINTGTFSMTSGTLNVGTVVNNGGTIQNLNFGTIAISDGTTKANVMASGISNGTGAQNAQLVAGGFAEIIGTITAGTTDFLAAMDVSNYKWVSVQLAGTWVGTANIQSSNDNANFQSQLQHTVIGGAGNPGQNMTSNNVYLTSIETRYLRVRMNAFTSGTAYGYIELYTSSPAFRNIQAAMTTGTITAGTIGTITNLGQVYNAGTLQAGTIGAGTFAQNPVPSKSIITFGTAGTVATGTLVAAPGVGTSIYVVGYSIDGDTTVLGTPEVCLSFGTVLSGTGVFTRSTLVSTNNPIVQTFPFGVNGGTSNLPLTYQIVSGAGSVAWNVQYFTQ